MNFKKKQLALASALVIAALGCNGANAASIKIAVAANFAAPLADIITAYKTAYGATNNITFVSGSSGTLLSAITSGYPTTINPSSYDIFLSADATRPATIVASYPLVDDGAAFNYATGYPVLWSNTAGVNIGTGLPANFNTLYGTVALADTSAAPYGTASYNGVLKVAPFSLTATNVTTASNPYPTLISVYNNIDNTYLAVKNGVNKIGFVAKSQVCQRSATGVESYTGTSHYTYSAISILQAGVKLKRSAANTVAADTTLRNSFVTFLSSPTATAIILRYCYTK
ncbi:molybdate ABC transporter substrate-binding protein [Derxia lacustris]|uniref:molybdate ABC transporter substrate-binding protein n=1 Tax=Derxia lacustris TaxID=764842 RepID=UPI000A175E72|nr:molybdate ABC transporter substrate-binding protein [Derxia lacustris]